MKKDLRVILKGGLGNQLLQYYAGLELSQYLDRQLVIDTSWFKRNVHSNGLLDQREFLLNQYKFSENINIIDKMNWKNSPLTERMIRKIPHRISNFIGFYPEMTQADYVIRTQKEIVIFGHWVNKPVLPTRDILRVHLVKNILNPSPSYSSLQKKVQQTNIISVHHRLGDYKNFGLQYGVIDEEYFAKAVRFLKRNLNSERQEVWLFSDEPELSLRMLSSKIEISQVISKHHKISESETISLISQSAGIVGSNSTFSWWAGLLSDDLKTSVIFPKDYMRDVETKQTGLYIDGWHYL